MRIAALLTAAALGIVAPVPPAGAAVRTRIKGFAAHFCFRPDCYGGMVRATPEQVAAWADYVEPSNPVIDAPAAKRAGIPYVLHYMDFNLMYTRQEYNDPPATNRSDDYLPACGAATPALTAAGARYWNLRSRDAVAHFLAYVAADRASGDINGVFWDDNLSAIENYNGGLQPCGLPASAWVAATTSIFSAMAAAGYGNIVVNGIGLAPTNGSTETLQQATLTAPGVIAGVFEGCYDNAMTRNAVLEGHSLEGRWRSTENAELETQAEGRDFICLAQGTRGAANVADRLYAFTSLLLTYEASHSVLWDAIPSSSNTGLFPENALVPARPLVRQPRTIAALRAENVYTREYAVCTHAGVAAGPCAVVVNPSANPQDMPELSRPYTHALELIGDDVFFGGTIAFGAPAPRRLAPVSGAVLFP